jgi:hypothetical protein
LWLTGMDPFRHFLPKADSPTSFWAMCILGMDSWRGFVDFFFRFSASVASEADCERYLSRMKLLVGSLRYRLSRETMHSLLSFLSPHHLPFS